MRTVDGVCADGMLAACWVVYVPSTATYTYCMNFACVAVNVDVTHGMVEKEDEILLRR